ncbi:MAG: hypothetical protein Q7U66_10820 [Methylobacter sp.]|nr:hypothetical protein [Methylobacter sp.]
MSSGQLFDLSEIWLLTDFGMDSLLETTLGMSMKQFEQLAA